MDDLRSFPAYSYPDFCAPGNACLSLSFLRGSLGLSLQIAAVYLSAAACDASVVISFTGRKDAGF